MNDIHIVRETQSRKDYNFFILCQAGSNCVTVFWANGADDHGPQDLRGLIVSRLIVPYFARSCRIFAKLAIEVLALAKWYT